MNQYDKIKKRDIEISPEAINQTGDISMKYCTVEDCKNKHLAKGYCGKHYDRLRHGLPLLASTIYDKRPAIIEGAIAKIPLGLNAKDGYAIVDKEYAYLDKYQWCINSDGYAHNSHGLLHHIIVGVMAKGREVDHKNNDKLDNRNSNLRIVTHQQNKMNQPLSSNVHGYKGVYKFKSRWYSRIKIDGKSIPLGGHSTLEQAAAAYNKAAIKHFGEYAFLNKISEGVTQ